MTFYDIYMKISSMKFLMNQWMNKMDEFLSFETYNQYFMLIQYILIFNTNFILVVWY